MNKHLPDNIKKYVLVTNVKYIQKYVKGDKEIKIRQF